MSTFIQAIGTAVPQYVISQNEVLQFMLKAHQLKGEDRKNLEVLYRATGIQTRYSVIKDYLQPDQNEFFPNNEELTPFPDTRQRQQKYRDEALELSLTAAKKCLETIDPSKITHLITVSCTGMYAPGLDIDLVNHLRLSPEVKRTAINFMGCYAAFNAIKVADAFCHSDKPVNALVVCTELCTLHFQKDNTENNFLANALFGDGSSALLLTNQKPATPSLEVSHFYSTLQTEGHEEMAWDIGNTGFEMKLSAYVPDFLKKGIDPMLNRLWEESNQREFDYYILHPGGKRILQVLEEKLGIGASENHFSRQVLKKFGNMSSATILFVLEALWNSGAMKNDQYNVLGLAFGPGLTLESMILTIHSHE
ncbi:type III polyketide synthase [Fulvivirga sedimenti]|uniref:Type III polyketide synthase n=1 Tax=Fulvivirga sedimenti TaxID=2879465 RepID=A0A9X1HU92_9BACT|nr:type III polyketide synthase [Fulvivirga sedimenti]MCA6078399.1 type III polyketide synthase [Fulvivirga sedimenti]